MSMQAAPPCTGPQAAPEGLAGPGAMQVFSMPKDRMPAAASTVLGLQQAPLATSAALTCFAPGSRHNLNGEQHPWQHLLLNLSQAARQQGKAQQTLERRAAASMASACSRASMLAEGLVSSC